MSCHHFHQTSDLVAIETNWYGLMLCVQEKKAGGKEDKEAAATKKA